MGGGRVEEVVDVLVVNLTSAAKPKDSSSRELGALGLKQLVSEAPPVGSAPTAALARRLAPALSQVVCQHAGSGGATPPPEVASDALDVLAALLGKCGHLAAGSAQHEALAPALAQLIEGGKPAVRKRATACLGALAPWMPDAALHAQVEARMASLKASSGGQQKGALVCARVIAAGAILRTASHRLGVDQLAHGLMPLLAQLCDSGAGDEDTREACLHALEGALSHARPGDAAPAVAVVTTTALKALCYDPNYAGAEEEGDADMMGDDGDADADDDQDGGDDDDGAYSDDEDVSWKVRRAAAKCLGAAVGVAAAVAEAPGGTAPLVELCTAAGPGLCTRLVREREETVKLDVVAVTEALLRALGQHGAVQQVAAATNTWTPLISKACTRMLAGTGASNARTKSGGFTLARELVTVAGPQGLGAQALPGFIASVGTALAEKGSAQASTLKMDALAFTKALLSSGGASATGALAPHMPTLVPSLCASVAQDPYYRTAAEALRCCGCCVTVLAGQAGSGQLVGALFEAARTKLASPDADTDVKETALATLGAVLSSCPGDLKPGDAAAGVAALLERTKNDTTRLSAVKALHTVCGSTHPAAAAALQPSCVGLATELTALLRKAARPLRSAAVDALGELLSAHGGTLPPADVAAAVSEAAPLITEADLALASGALNIARFALLRAGTAPQVQSAVKQHIQPHALRLLPSPLVGGASAVALRRFFGAVGHATGGSQPELKAMVDALLTSPAAAGAGKHAASVAASCVGGCAAGAGGASCEAMAQELLGRLSTAKAAHGATPVTLLSLGELGRRTDLRGHSSAVVSALMAACDAPGEEVKDAAATALGNITTGGLDHFLPLLLASTTADTKHQYQLLQALRVVLTPTEVEGSGAVDDVTHPPAGGPASLNQAQAEAVCTLLFNLADASEDGVRAMVSECLGCALVAHPALLVPHLRARYVQHDAPTALARAVCVHAARCALIENPQLAAAALAGAPADDVLACLSDPDYRVRHASAACLAAAAHYPACHGPLVMPRLEASLPGLLALCQPVPELVRIVDLGPFKITEDDGLECRKAAFECVDALLGIAPGLVATDATAAAIMGGLSDAYDIKVTAHAALARLCGSAPRGVVLQHVDGAADALEKTILFKLKQDAVKQEVDRNDDLVRSALRCVHVLQRLPGAMEASPKLTGLVTKTIGASPQLAAKYKSEEANAATLGGGVAGAGGDGAVAMDVA